jgi:hypothetical protein
MRACKVTVLRGTLSDILRMHNEYSPKGKTSSPTCVLPWLFVYIYKSAGSMLLFTVVSS